MGDEVCGLVDEASDPSEPGRLLNDDDGVDDDEGLLILLCACCFDDTNDEVEGYDFTRCWLLLLLALLATVEDELKCR